MYVPQQCRYLESEHLHVHKVPAGNWTVGHLKNRYEQYLTKHLKEVAPFGSHFLCTQSTSVALLWEPAIPTMCTLPFGEGGLKQREISTQALTGAVEEDGTSNTCSALCL